MVFLGRRHALWDTPCRVRIWERPGAPSSPTLAQGARERTLLLCSGSLRRGGEGRGPHPHTPPKEPHLSGIRALGLFPQDPGTPPPKPPAGHLPRANPQVVSSSCPPRAPWGQWGPCPAGQPAAALTCVRPWEAALGPAPPALHTQSGQGAELGVGVREGIWKLTAVSF